MEDDSPWLLIRVEASGPMLASLHLPREFAMWRETRHIYHTVNHQVLEDPVLTEAITDHGPILRPPHE
jgi:hypothetical protein